MFFCRCCVFCFFKQKTAYEMRISDWSSDVCSSDLWGIGIHKIEMLEQSGAELLKCLLIVERKAQRIEISASLVFDPLTNKIDARTRCFGRGLSGQPFAHPQATGRGQRHFLAAMGTADLTGTNLQQNPLIAVGGNA